MTSQTQHVEEVAPTSETAYAMQSTAEKIIGDAVRQDPCYRLSKAGTQFELCCDNPNHRLGTGSLRTSSPKRTFTNTFESNTTEEDSVCSSPECAELEQHCHTLKRSNTCDSGYTSDGCSYCPNIECCGAKGRQASSISASSSVEVDDEKRVKEERSTGEVFSTTSEETKAAEEPAITPRSATKPIEMLQHLNRPSYRRWASSSSMMHRNAMANPGASTYKLRK